MGEITTVGLDLAKRVVSVCGEERIATVRLEVHQLAFEGTKEVSCVWGRQGTKRLPPEALGRVASTAAKGGEQFVPQSLLEPAQDSGIFVGTDGHHGARKSLFLPLQLPMLHSAQRVWRLSSSFPPFERGLM